MKKILTGIISLTLLLLNHPLELHANNQNEKVSALEYQFTASEIKMLSRIEKKLEKMNADRVSKIHEKIGLLKKKYEENEFFFKMLIYLESYAQHLLVIKMIKVVDDMFIGIQPEEAENSKTMNGKNGEDKTCKLQGDINGDGEVNRKDTKLLSKIIINEEEKNSCSDVNGDGKLTVKDIVLVSSIESATDGDGKITVDLDDDQGEYQVSQEGNMCVVKNNYTADCSCPENYESTGGIAFGDGPRMYVCYKDLY